MTEPEGPLGSSSAWQSRRLTFAFIVGAVGIAALTLALLATRGPVSGEAGVANPADAEVSVEEALAQPEPELPTNMPTAKPAKLGAPLDPLSAEEVGYARSLANEDAGEGGERVDGTPGLQFLTVGLTETDGTAPTRSATINSYDYATDELVTQVVDLATGKVDTKRAKGVQPPPSKREGDVAMTMLLAAPESAALKDDYKSYTRRTLTSPDQLDYAAGTWTADERSTGAKKCGEHRCVFFQIRTQDGRGLVLTDQIVDLSAGKVETLKP